MIFTMILGRSSTSRLSESRRRLRVTWKLHRGASPSTKPDSSMTFSNSPCAWRPAWQPRKYQGQMALKWWVLPKMGNPILELRWLRIMFGKPDELDVLNELGRCWNVGDFWYWRLMILVTLPIFRLETLDQKPSFSPPNRRFSGGSFPAYPPYIVHLHGKSSHILQHPLAIWL